MKQLLIVCLLLSLVLPGAAATTYYVAKTGSDSNNCTQAQSTSTPKLTIASGLGCLTAGNADTLQVRAGTYAESILSGWKSGTTWGTAMTLRSYQNEDVTIKPNSGARVIQFDTGDKYIIIDGSGDNAGKHIILDGTNVTGGIVKIYRDHIRLKNLELTGGSLGGISVHAFYGANTANFNEMIGLYVHDLGNTPYDNGIYITSEDNLVEHCEVYKIGGAGIQLYYDSGTFVSRNTIRYNKIHRTSDASGTGSKSQGIIVSRGDSNLVYNNLIYDYQGTGPPSGAIYINFSATNSKIYNNTIYSFTPGIAVLSGSTSAVIRNNIVYSSGANYSNQGVSTTASNNLLGVDPLFVNVGTFDLHLSAGSRAIDAGIDLSSSFTDDFDGTTRPLGLQWDIGAYEYGSPPASISVLTPNGGESWTVGTAQTITWSSVGAGSTVDITLDRANDGTFEETIVSGATNNGSYTWSSVTGGNSSNVKIKVKDSGAATNDVNDAVFTITGTPSGSITPTGPTSGQRFGIGDTIPIAWTTAGISGLVKIELTRNNGGTWETIYPSAAYNASNLTFTANVPASSTCKFRFTSQNDSTVTATGSTFRIGGTYIGIAP